MKKIKVEKLEKRKELARLMNERKKGFSSFKYRYLHGSAIRKFNMLSHEEALNNAKEDSVFRLLYDLKTVINNYVDECRKQNKEPRLRYKNLLLYATEKELKINKKKFFFDIYCIIPFHEWITVFGVRLEEPILYRVTLKFEQFSSIIFYEIPKMITHFRNLLDELASKEEAKKEIFNEFDAMAIEKFAEMSS